jgi:hypothetical protein
MGITKVILQYNLLNYNLINNYLVIFISSASSVSNVIPPGDNLLAWL